MKREWDSELRRSIKEPFKRIYVKKFKDKTGRMTYYSGEGGTEQVGRTIRNETR